MDAVLLGFVVFSACLFLGRAMVQRRRERASALLGVRRQRSLQETAGRRAFTIEGWASKAQGLLRSRWAPVAWVPVGALLGLRLAGLLGLVAGATVAWGAPVAMRRKRRLRRDEALERQLAEVAEASALAVRSGLSVAQALEFAAGEIEPPLAELLDRFRGEQSLGVPFEQALENLGRDISTDDGKLFALVMSIHSKSGGNLAGALEEVTTTIRHRIAVRRELRALSAQGRISGTVLGVLPIAFFVLLATTSHRELGPVYRSPAGAVMVGSGLVMQAVAYLWIRKLMRVEA